MKITLRELKQLIKEQVSEDLGADASSDLDQSKKTIEELTYELQELKKRVTRLERASKYGGSRDIY